jgi:copper oxidase (laccase) domain-containing protein
VIGAVHAGWRGVVSGVVAECAAVMRRHGGLDLRAIVGPCIHAECYEFGIDDLARVVDVVGDAAVGKTATHRPAMDLPAAVVAAMQRAEIVLDEVIDHCTACEPQQFFSHRSRAESGRQVMVLWRSEADG